MAKLWTISALALELERDRRALTKALDDLSADEESKDGAGRVTRKWKLAKVFAHLSGGNGELDGNAERARKDKESADKLALENAETRGDVARVSRMESELAALFGDHRSNALALPNKLAPALVGLNADQIRDRIEASIYELLGDLADYRPGTRTRRDTEIDTGSGQGGETATEVDDKPVGRRKAKAKPRE